MTTTIWVAAICGGLAGYLTTYLRIRYEIHRNTRNIRELSPPAVVYRCNAGHIHHNGYVCPDEKVGRP
jgi:hypothetical protein